MGGSNGIEVVILIDLWGTSVAGDHFLLGTPSFLASQISYQSHFLSLSAVLFLIILVMSPSITQPLNQSSLDTASLHNLTYSHHFPWHLLQHHTNLPCILHYPRVFFRALDTIISHCQLGISLQISVISHWTCLKWTDLFCQIWFIDLFCQITTPHLRRGPAIQSGLKPRYMADILDPTIFLNLYPRLVG